MAVTDALTLYPAPKGLDPALLGRHHRVKVNGRFCAVFRTEVTVGAYYRSGFAEYVSFDFSGSVTLRVTADYPIRDACLLPSRHTVPVIQDGDTLTFTLTRPGAYFLRLNGTDDNGNTAPHPLYIFAAPPEEDIPDKNDPNVVWFEPGIHSHRSYTLESGKTYYLAGGAFVHGRFCGENVRDVTIRGRGTLCGEKLTDLYDEGRTVCVRDSERITLKGIRIMHPKVWTVAFYNCRSVHIQGICTIGHGMSSDGCDICGCRDVMVEDCFFRGHDDILAVKSSVGLPGAPHTEQAISCENVIFRRCVAWCDSSNAMTVGYETAGDVRHIRFEEIDVLNQSQPPVWRLEAVMAIEPHYAGQVEDVCFKDIRVDVALPRRPLQSLFRFCVDAGTGSIRQVRIEDVWVAGDGCLGGRIRGKAPAPPITDIVFDRVRNAAGRGLQENDVLTNERVTDVRITPTSDSAPAEEVATYDFLWDYSDVPGFQHWYYRWRDKESGQIYPMQLKDERWERPGSFCLIQYGFMHPDHGCDPLLCWEAPRDGRIRLTSTLLRKDAGGDGTRVYVLYNGSQLLWEQLLPPEKPSPREFSLELDVRAGDTVAIGADCLQNPDCDGVDLAPLARYIESA